MVVYLVLVIALLQSVSATQRDISAELEGFTHFVLAQGLPSVDVLLILTFSMHLYSSKLMQADGTECVGLLNSFRKYLHC